MTWQAELEALIEETMAHVKAMEGAKVKPVAPVKIIENAIAEPPRLARLESMTASSVRSEREEIKRRVASFKAVQERMQQEREDYCDRTLSVACFAVSGKERTAGK